MAQPVVDHELEPGGGGQVEARRRNEGVPGQELVADRSRIRLQQVSVRLGIGFRDRYVPAKAHLDTAHRRVAEIVVGAIRRTPGQVPVVCRRLRLHLAVVGQGCRVVEVLLAHAHPDAFQDRKCEWQGQPVPPPGLIDGFGRAHKKVAEAATWAHFACNKGRARRLVTVVRPQPVP